MSDRKFRGTLLVLAGTLLLGGCGSSGSPPQQGAAPSPQAAAPAPAAPAATPAASQPETAALREFLDPVTGQPREPTEAELKAMAAARPAAPAASAASKPKEIVLPNGMVVIEGTSLMSEMKGCVQPDGSVVADHDCREKAAAPVKKP